MEGNAGDGQRGDDADNGAPGGEVIDRDKGMGALADPADGGVGPCCATGTDEADPDGHEALCGGRIVTD